MDVEVIRSRQNGKVRHFVLLREDSSYRDGVGAILVVGRRLVSEVASSSKITTLIVEEGVVAPPNIISDNVVVCNAAVMAYVTGMAQSDGYAAEVRIPERGEVMLESCSRLLALDGVADPGNVGTLFRTALALGWEAIVLLPGCCDPYNDKAVRAGRAAQLFIPHLHVGWDDLLAIIARGGFTPLVAAMEGTPLPEVEKEVPTPTLLILGNEGRGVVVPDGMVCRKVSIPMHSSVESLNVSTAGSILMYALKRPSA